MTPNYYEALGALNASWGTPSYLHKRYQWTAVVYRSNTTEILGSFRVDPTFARSREAAQDQANQQAAAMYGPAIEVELLWN